MIDQSFSSRNFRKILDADLKKQGELARNYFPSDFEVYRRIKSLVRRFRRYSILLKHKKISLSHYEQRKELIIKLIELRKKDFDESISRKLSDISSTINRKGFKLPLELSSYKISGKDVYSIGSEIESMFTSLNLIRILKTVYSICPSNRNIVTSRLKKVLEDGSHKVVIRVDVERFYESIPHDKLLSLIHSDPSLSVIPKRIITQLVRDYSLLTGDDCGVPRGVGISAYISEIFMRDIDILAESLRDVVYYARYVDDLVFVFCPSEPLNKSEYLDQIKGLMSQKGLSLNKKTEVLDISPNSGNQPFEYLGYRFVFHGTKLTVDITKKKINKYKKRIDLSFDDYLRKSKCTPNLAERLLLKRIKFLSGNTRLHNSKRNAFVGTYASNQNITTFKSFLAIDRYYKHKISSIPDPKLSKKLSKYSFEAGARYMIFRNFTPSDLSKITEIWNHG